MRIGEILQNALDATEPERRPEPPLKQATAVAKLLWCLLPTCSELKSRYAIGCILMFSLASHSWCANAGTPSEDGPDHRWNHFHHTMWTSENGLGAVSDIQQGADGFLWLTTSTGVFRFDGVRFQSVEEATNGAVSTSDIQSVFLSRSGGIWLKTRAAGMIFWKDGRRVTYQDRRCTPAWQIEGLAEDFDGSLWIQSSGGLFHMQGTGCEQIGPEHGYSGGFPAAIMVDHKGSVWVRTLAGDLLFRPQGARKFNSLRYAAGDISASFVLPIASHSAYLHEAADGSIWLSDDHGLRRVTDKDGKVLSPNPGRKQREALQFGDFTFDRNGSLWAVTNMGVRRFDDVERLRTPLDSSAAPGEGFDSKQGLSSSAIGKVFIDREGSVWVGTNSGLDRLRATSIATLSFNGVEEHDFALAAGQDGSVWTGNSSSPLTHVQSDGCMAAFSQTGGSICLRRDRNGVLWSMGLDAPYLWRSSGTTFLREAYPKKDVGLVISLAVDRNNALWISTASGGDYRLNEGRWLKQNHDLGKKDGLLGSMAGDEMGNVWFGFANKLVRWDGSNYQTYSFPNGTPGASETTMSIHGSHVWLGGVGGVQLFSSGNFHLLRWKDTRLPGRVTGIVESQDGDLWINGTLGITHVAAVELARWLNDPTSALSAEHLDALDGLPGLSAERVPEPSIIQSTDGRIWAATTNGVARLDPATLHRNRNQLPPPITISAVVSNGKVYSGLSDVELPIHTDRVEIDYTALSLAVPERVNFRYKLDGVDKDWQDSGGRREAIYTNLTPGRHRFHVIACNNDGVWNEAGRTLDFTILPAFYQTRWFFLLCLIAAGLLILTAYRNRVRRVTALLDMQFQERLSERTRIAGELHDTLLQSIQGLILHFQRARNLLPANPEEAGDRLETALERAEQAIVEGRNAIHDIRSSTFIQSDLAQALTLLGEELGPKVRTENSGVLNVVIEGVAKPLAPALRDEVYFIAREALRNAFNHSKAAHIEAEIVYGKRLFRVRVRDDGEGIDRRILDQETRGHWGLIGMRERAKRVGGQVDIWSEDKAGTEIELTIPGAIAYELSNAGNGFRLFRKRKSAINEHRS